MCASVSAVCHLQFSLYNVHLIITKSPYADNVQLYVCLLPIVHWAVVYIKYVYCTLYTVLCTGVCLVCGAPAEVLGAERRAQLHRARQAHGVNDELLYQYRQSGSWEVGLGWAKLSILHKKIKYSCLD